MAGNRPCIQSTHTVCGCVVAVAPMVEEQRGQLKQHQEQGGEEKQSPFLGSSAQWLQDVGAQIPASSIQQAGEGFYDCLVTHSIAVDLAEPGRVVCTLRVPARLCNPLGRLHGGAITSLVDVIGSAPIYATGLTHSGVSTEINVTFMAGASLGEEIEIEAKALRIGRNLAVVSVDLRIKATGQLVAQGRHSKFLAIPPTSSPHSRL